MKLSRSIILLITAIFLNVCAKAQQDLPLSYTSSLPIQINAANTGMMGTDYRIATYYRTQYASDGVKAMGASAEMNFIENKMGAGLDIYSNSMGKSSMQDFSCLGSFAYRIQFYEKEMKKQYLTFGLQAGFRQVGYSVNDFTFGSQYDPTISGGINNNMPDDIQDKTKMFFDANLGLAWDAGFSNKLSSHFDVGLWHIVKQDINFNSDTAVYTSAKFSISGFLNMSFQRVYVVPSMLYSLQDGISNFEIGGKVGMASKTAYNEIVDVDLGLYFRASANSVSKANSQAFIPTVGFSYKGVTIGFNTEFYLNNFGNFANVFLIITPKIF